MRYVLAVIVLFFGVMICTSARAEIIDPPQAAGIHFFCISPQAMNDVAEAMQVGEDEMMAVAEEYEAVRQCFYSAQKLPVMAVSRKDTPFTNYRGDQRWIYIGVTPSGRRIFFPGPAIGDPA